MLGNDRHLAVSVRADLIVHVTAISARLEMCLVAGTYDLHSVWLVNVLPQAAHEQLPAMVDHDMT